MLASSLATLEAHDPNVLRLYEGLIFSTARRYSIFVEEDLEDIQQILRVKVFRALESYDGAKAPARTDGRDPRDAYVFQCVRNQAKDLLKKKPRHESYIDDSFADEEGSGRDWFEHSIGMATTHDQVYGEIEDDDLVVPNTLTELERQVVCLLYAGYRQSEVARSLCLVKRDMERAMRSIRLKMEDWRPTVLVKVPELLGATVGVAA